MSPLHPSVALRDIPLAAVAAVARAASRHDGLAVLDLGEEGSLVTWGRAPVTRSDRGWPADVRAALAPGPAGAAISRPGGVVGWIGFEAGQDVERMPTHPGALAPDVSFWRYEGTLRRLPGGEWRVAGDARFRAEAEAVLAEAAAAPATPPPAVAQAPATGPLPARHYQAAVGAALDHIAAGDIYQVCLAWERRLPAPTDPIAAWLALRDHNPAARGALLRHGATWVLSNSPELFLAVVPGPAGATVRSVPIKGTAPSAAGPAGAAALLASDKERAELTMIVDLVRSDIGRVAAPGTVAVGPRQLRVCGDLLHTEQAVSARLAPGRDAVDAAAAAFPPGSVTGAPKVRAMALIHALEPGPRGVYTGAIGFFADDGAAHLNVAIRTVTVRDGHATTHLGAGIVADSDPAREWAETVAKGAALARVLGVP